MESKAKQKMKRNDEEQRRKNWSRNGEDLGREKERRSKRRKS